jgi:hypothetical protein
MGPTCRQASAIATVPSFKLQYFVQGMRLIYQSLHRIRRHTFGVIILGFATDLLVLQL